MPTLPRDLEDLRLAPVLLALDAQVEDLSRLGAAELLARVALESGMRDDTPQERERALMASVAHCLDLHGWRLQRDPRGIRVTHGRHTVVLGVPATFGTYVDGG